MGLLIDMKVPLLDLKAQYGSIALEIERRLKGVFESQRFILSENVDIFEREIARYCGVGYGIGVASGSDAILLSLMAIGVSAGDSVITTPYTFFATAGSIARLGARPVFVDIDPETFNIDPNRLEDYLKKAGNGLKAIIPVHLFGQCADMDPILELAGRYGLKVIEDAAQAIGAEYKGRRAGSMGDMGCFSFFPTKNLGGVGDGGMVVTNDRGLANKVRTLRVHGSNPKYHHNMIGINSRLDEIQAAVLRVKLKYLDGWTEKRVRNGERYCKLFESAGLLDRVILPAVMSCNKSVFNQFVVRVRDRDRLWKHLTKAGIGTEVYYPIPLHLQGCFSYLGYREGDFPEAERAAREALALPIYPELTEEMQGYVVDGIRGFYEGKNP